MFQESSENPKIVGQPVYHSESELKTLSQVDQIFHGYLWIVDALVKEFLEKGQDESSFRHIEKRLEEILAQLQAAHDIEQQLLGYQHFHSDGHVTHDHQPFGLATDRFPMDFFDALNELVAASEKMRATTILMIAGNQGSGKDTLADHLAKTYNYEILSMSSIVREVSSAWGLEANNTEHKIVAGQVFKEYFGQDILVYLGVYDLIRQGKKKIIIVGPRVLAEVDAAKKMGAKIIGVVADKNPSIDKKLRRERITHRSAFDEKRQQDALKFDEREMIESPQMNQVLQQVDFFIENNSSQIDEFYLQAESILQHVLKKE